MFRWKKHVRRIAPVKDACASVIENLESRRLLAAVPGDFLERLAAHQLSDEEMAANDYVSMDWHGQQIYAKQDEWLVKVKLDAGRGFPSAKSVIDQLGLGAEFKHTVGESDLALVSLSGGAGYAQLAASLGSLGLFEYAEPNAIFWPEAVPNDPMFPSQYALNNTGQSNGTADADIDATEVWDVTTGNANTVIGVIDTGVDYNHPDLLPNIWTNPGEIPNDGIDNDSNGVVDDVHGANFMDPIPNGNVLDDVLHGTHVAGIIAAAGNNGRGVTGVAWNARIVAIKALGPFGGSEASLVGGIDYATNLHNRGINIRVTNNSWGGDIDSQAIHELGIPLTPVATTDSVVTGARGLPA